LSDALSDWGDEQGAIVVISHDKAFCEKVGFTHVATVEDGGFKVEQRSARESDWDSSVSTLQPTSALTEGEEEDGDEDDNPEKEVDAKVRKQAYNAPKRIAKIEDLVENKEAKIAKLDSEMLANGSDMGKLVDLNKEKEKLEEQVMELMEEWEELEEVLALVA
jgi:hypothetical protein